MRNNPMVLIVVLFLSVSGGLWFEFCGVFWRSDIPKASTPLDGAGMTRQSGVDLSGRTGAYPPGALPGAPPRISPVVPSRTDMAPATTAKQTVAKLPATRYALQAVLPDSAIS